jgi:hypothetical protein
MKNKRTILGVPLTLIVLGIALALVLTASSPSGSWHTIYQGAFAASSSPDSYGDRIAALSIYQYPGHWNLQYYDEYGSYTSGTTVNINSGLNTYFVVACMMNVTKFPAPAGLAACTITIAGTSHTASASTPSTQISVGGQLYWYWAFTWDNAGAYWVPSASTTYSLVLTYSVYY